MVQQRRQRVTACHCRLFGGDIFSREQLRVDGVRVRGAQRFQQRERVCQSLCAGLLDTAAQQDNQNTDIFIAHQQAAGIPLSQGNTTLRVSFSGATTPDDVERFVRVLADCDAELGKRA